MHKTGYKRSQNSAKGFLMSFLSQQSIKVSSCKNCKRFFCNLFFYNFSCSSFTDWNTQTRCCCKGYKKNFFSTSLQPANQPISCCKMIKTSEKGEERGEKSFSAFLFRLTAKKRNVLSFYNFIAFLVSDVCFVLSCLFSPHYRRTFSCRSRRERLFNKIILIFFKDKVLARLGYNFWHKTRQNHTMKWRITSK